MRGTGRFRRALVLAASLLVGSSAFASFALGDGPGGAATTVLDHFECYAAAVTTTPAAPKPFSHTPSKVLLKNRFTPGGFSVAPGAPVTQCNPVQPTVTTNGHTVTTAVRNASAHLLCRAIGPKGLRLPAAMTLKNQFGTGTVRPTAARSLCLPSWTTQKTPLKFPATNAPGNLDAYACYAAVHPQFTTSFAVPKSVKLKDQFAGVTVRPGGPNLLCIPTSRTVTAAKVEPGFVNPDRYIVCYSIPAAAEVTTRTVYDRNQFGIGALKVARRAELCLPSTQVVGVPPTTTTSTTAPTTTTTTPLGTPIAVTDYTDPSIRGAFDITTGADGALWFTNGDNDSIGRITTAGAVTNFGDPSTARPDGIAAGPDGALWFTNAGNNSIGRITTAGAITNFTNPTVDAPFDIVAGADGALWFTNYGNNTIGRITTAGVITNFTSAGAPTGHGISFPDGITAGPDGALWFANTGYGTIGRITTAGVVSNFSDPSMATPYRITTGPDGALWFTNGGNNSIGRITTAGAVTNYADPTISSPQGIVSAPDGALWFVNLGNSSIGRITTSGAITNYINPAAISSPYSITVGPDSFLWLTNSGNGSIGRFAPAT